MTFVEELNLAKEQILSTEESEYRIPDDWNLGKTWDLLSKLAWASQGNNDLISVVFDWLERVYPDKPEYALLMTRTISSTAEDDTLLAIYRNPSWIRFFHAHMDFTPQP